MPFPLTCTATALLSDLGVPSSAEQILERVRGWLTDEGAIALSSSRTSLTFRVPFDLVSGLWAWRQPVLAAFDGGSVVIAKVGDGWRVDLRLSTRRICAACGLICAGGGLYLGMHGGVVLGLASALGCWFFAFGFLYLVSFVRAVANLEQAVRPAPETIGRGRTA